MALSQEIKDVLQNFYASGAYKTYVPPTAASFAAAAALGNGPLSVPISRAAETLGCDQLAVKRLLALGRLKAFDSPSGPRIATTELQGFLTAGAPGLREVPRTFRDMLTADERDVANAALHRVTEALKGFAAKQSRAVVGRLGTIEAPTPGRFKTGGDHIIALLATRELERHLSRELTSETLAATIARPRHLYESRERLQSARAATVKAVMQHRVSSSVRASAIRGDASITGEAALTSNALGGPQRVAAVLDILL